MSDPPRDDVTTLLAQLSRGDAAAANRLFPLIYDELRALAQRLFRHQPGDVTLQPTALVHEAYMRLVDQTRPAQWDRTHFFNVAALAMRQILVDHARRRRAAKRGGDRQRVGLDAVDPVSSLAGIDLIALDDALRELAELDERHGRVVELRFLAGLTVEETAAVLGVSPRTVKADWCFARAWLRRQLGEGEPE